MEGVMFSFNDQTAGGVPDKLICNKDLESFEGGFKGKQVTFYGGEGWGETEGAIDALTSDHGFYGDESLQEGFSFCKYGAKEQQQEQRLFIKDYGIHDGRSFDAATPPIQTCLEEIAELGQINNGFNQDVAVEKKENENKKYPFSISSLGILNNYGRGYKRFKGERKIERNNDIAMSENETDRTLLSTEEIMRAAGEMFLQSSCRTMDSCISMLNDPIDPSLSGLSDQETRDVELAVLLLAAAEKVCYQQYERATRLLKQCDYNCSKTGNPVQRVVYYFAEALREKIERETGTFSSKCLRTKPLFDIYGEMMKPNPTTIACHGSLPFCQVIQFTAIQSIFENVAESKRIHIIDFAIRNGVQWTILMQSLASRYDPIELLKITAVATDGKDLIEDTGRRLSSFARSLGFPFAFNLVIVSDMLDLKEDLIELDAEETVVVYASFTFRSMLAMPNRIENIMRVICIINPCLMVVNEVEANHNSPNFFNRFIEVLFFFSTFFDCVASCMEKDCRNRELTESVYLGEGIRNMVATEGEERKIRHVKFDVWRAFFVRYGMEETELSMSCWYQAELLLKTFPCGSFCTLDKNGKSLLVGWKGTPVRSLSVWKFV